MKLTIERLGHQGDGVAPGPIFVSSVLPGEVVEGDIAGDRMIAPRILEPSPNRVSPPCRHFKRCGGCLLQHASDAFVAEWKKDVVQTALAAHGIEVSVGAVHSSPARSRRRAALSGRRTKKGAIIGFHARGSGEIIDIPDCQLLHPDLMAVLPALHDMTMSWASRKGELSFTLTQSGAGVDISVQGENPLMAPCGSGWPRFANTMILLVWPGWMS